MSPLSLFFGDNLFSVLAPPLPLPFPFPSPESTLVKFPLVIIVRVPGPVKSIKRSLTVRIGWFFYLLSTTSLSDLDNVWMWYVSQSISVGWISHTLKRWMWVPHGSSVCSPWGNSASRKLNATAKRNLRYNRGTHVKFTSWYSRIRARPESSTTSSERSLKIPKKKFLNFVKVTLCFLHFNYRPFDFMV